MNDHHHPTFQKTSISQARAPFFAMLLHGPTLPLTRATSAAGKKTRRYAGYDKFIICMKIIYEYEKDFEYKQQT